ncbi:hypothetical protein [Mycolicibacterium hodleri]|nr:hypothetical protein [Mycolicibacterium hodleri]
MRYFQYDPFSVLGSRANCTVGALRKQVEDHDVSIKSQSRGGRSGDSAQLARDLVKMAAGPGGE